MTTKHTPGEWTVSNLDCQGNEMESHIFIEPGIAVIEKAIEESPHAQYDMPNALLIAAAPELLECLILLTDKGVKQATGLGWNERVRMARAAIAKATGEQL